MGSSANKTRFGDDYGTLCAAHDSDCVTKWPDDVWVGPRSGCCDSWCYVREECPLSSKSKMGKDLFYSFDTCDNDKTLKFDADKGKCEKSRLLSQSREEEDNEEEDDVGEGAPARRLSEAGNSSDVADMPA